MDRRESGIARPAREKLTFVAKDTVSEEKSYSAEIAEVE